MKDSGVEWIGEIPEDWEVSQISRYFNPRNEKVSDIDYKPLSVTKNGIVPQLDNAAKSSNHNDRKLVRKEDFVINSRSDRKMSSGIAKEDGSVSLINIVLFSRNILPMYTNYLLNNYSFAEEFYKWGSGIVADLWSTNWEKMKKINIPIPPVTEQEEIAIALDLEIDKINTIISDTQQSIIELKRYKQSLITETVTKGLDKTVEMKDSGIEVLGKINKDFRIISLGYLGDFQNGISKSGDSFGKGYPFVSYSDVYKNRVLPKKTTNLVQSTIEEQKNYSVRKNDIFFTRTSEIIEEIGMSSACYETIEQATFSGFVIRFRPNVNIFLVKFLRYFLEGSFVREYFSKEMNIVTRASLGQGLLKKLPIVLPSLEEQQQIVEFLDNKTSKIDSLISDKEKMITEYESYKKSLIYEYVTGKKQV